MKYLLTAIACCLAVAGSAQTWNPDADFDNVIGVNDLMALLSVFGSEWTAEYPQDPEYDLAAYYQGLVSTYACISACASNHARVMNLDEFAIFQDSIIIGSGEEVLWPENPCNSNSYSVKHEYHHWLLKNNSEFGYSHTVRHDIQECDGWAPTNEQFSWSLGAEILQEETHCVCVGLIPVVD